MTLKDDFDGILNDEIWETRRTNPYYWRIENSTLKITVEKDIRETSDVSKIDRVELAEKEIIMLSLGQSIWYSFSFFFPNDFLIVDNRLVFAQWKQYAPHWGSPFLSARYRNNILSIKITAEDLVKTYEKPIDLRGSWHSLLVNYQLNTDQTGFAKVWLDAEDQLVDYVGPLDYFPPPKKIFFKMGLYRDTIDQPQTIYFRKFRRGLSRENVII
jgi:hypothetical protein